MDIVDRIKALINKVDKEEFIISIPIIREEEVGNGRKEIQAKSGCNKDGQGKTSL